MRRSVHCTALFSVCSLRRAKFPIIYPDLRLDYKVATLPLAEFIEETTKVLGTDAHEVLVERAKPLRNNPGPDESTFVMEFNDLMVQPPG